jgi:hypothetical protein
LIENDMHSHRRLRIRPHQVRVCPRCDTLVGVADLIAAPGPGLPPIDAHADPVTAALARPHRMLQPVDTRDTPQRRVYDY